MKLVKYLNKLGRPTVGFLDYDEIHPLTFEGEQFKSLADLLEADDIPSNLQFLMDRSTPTIPLN